MLIIPTSLKLKSKQGKAKQTWIKGTQKVLSIKDPYTGSYVLQIISCNMPSGIVTKLSNYYY